MSNTFDGLMRDVCKHALQNDFEALCQHDFSDVTALSLDGKGIQKLTKKIVALPLEYMNTLFFRYCFNFSPEDTDAILETTCSAGRLRYIRSMLSGFMGLDGALVDDRSMRLACQAALSQYIVQDMPEVLRIPKYSDAFRKKLKAIKVAQKSTRMAMTVIKRVAVFILICAISFSTALAANAQFRERFLNWIVETFPEFSVFTTQTTALPEATVLNQDDIAFGYLPDGYNLSDIFQGRTMLVYDFLNDGGDKSLEISFVISKSGAKTYFNTEDAEIQSVPFKQSEAYTWKTDRMTYFVWIQDNIDCQILGNLDYIEIKKIAENVELKK